MHLNKICLLSVRVCTNLELKDVAPEGGGDLVGV